MDFCKWDIRFSKLAIEVATWSKDPNKQVGAVVVSPDKREISYGYNGFPAPVEDDDRLQNREIKNELSLHAEVNAVLNAKKDLAGWTLYCSKPICISCALVIIQSGISAVVMPPSTSTASNWHASCNKALLLFKEAYIDVRLKWKP